MKSKVLAVKNKRGGWNIKMYGESNAEILNFFAVSFLKFVESFSAIEDKKTCIDIMRECCAEAEKALKELEQDG